MSRRNRRQAARKPASRRAPVELREGEGARAVKAAVKGTGDAVKSAARETRHAAKKNAGNPWLEKGARMGYVIRGLLYGVIGVLGIGYAFGRWGLTADQRGSLYLLKGNPLRLFVLAAVLVGLACYSLWGFIRAALDPLNRGDGATGVAARLGFAWSGLSYAGLFLFCVQFLLGPSKTGNDDATQKAVASVLSAPFGFFLAMLVGAVAVAAGLGQFLDTVKASFSKDFRRQRKDKGEEAVVDSLGRFGMFSRGVVFTMMGAFVIQAALHHDARKAGGMGAAMRAIATAPAGYLLLAVVSLGFVALGLHSFACAKWIKMSRG